MNEKKFKIKSGFCHVLPDKIVFTRNGIVENRSAVTTGNTINRSLIINVVISVSLLVFAYTNFVEGNKLSGNLALILSLLIALNIIKGYSSSSASVINREKIKEIEFKNATTGTARSYFIIHFDSGKGSVKQRIIVLPSPMNKGQEETDKALKIMTAEFGTIKNIK